MSRNNDFSVISVLLFFSSIMVCSGSYLILAPRVFIRGKPINIALTLSQGETTITTELIGTMENKKELSLASGYISLKSGQSRLLTIMAPSEISVDIRHLKLSIIGKGSVSFDDHITMQESKNQSVVFVQTDKNIYKPGQLVHFRVLNLEKDLVPKNSFLSALIVNDKGTKLERFDNLKSANGVVEREFQLSPYASLGAWSIKLLNEMEDVVYSNPFIVDEYVLPKFSVEVIPDPDFLIWGIYDQPPAIIVKTKYTYGRAVQGQCVLTIGQAGVKQKQRLSQAISDTGDVEFVDINWASLIGNKPATSKQLQVDVEVTDVMGRVERETAVMDVFPGDYKIEILPQSPDVVHSDLPIEFYIKVADHFGKPVAGQEVQIEVSLPMMSTITSTIVTEPGKSFVTFAFTPVWIKKDLDDNMPESAISGSFRVQLASDSLIRASKKIYWYVSQQSDNVKIQVPFQLTIKKGEPVEFNVLTKSTRLDRSVFAYSVANNGVVLETGLVENNKVRITPTLAMCPSATLIVFIMLPELGKYKPEVIADSVKLSPSMCIDHKTKVTFDTKEQRTGTEANLQIDVVGEDGSNEAEVHDVFYLAVDKSIVLLQGDTSVEDKKILDVLGNMNKQLNDPVPYVTRRVFSNQGVEIMSNIEMPDPTEEQRVFMEAMVPGILRKSNDQEFDDTVQDLDNTKIKESSAYSAPTKIRKDFPDTWLWGHGKTGENGQFRTQVNLPDTITSWHVSAFAVNKNGIAPAGPTFELTAFQPFFLSLNLPYSIKRGEVFNLVITLFNYRPQKIKAIIKLKTSDDFIITKGLLTDGWHEHFAEMQPNRATSVEYGINATTLGRIKFHVVAEDMEDSAQKDEVIKQLLVKPPGELREKAMSDVLLLVDQNSVSKTFNIDWPVSNIIEGSRRLQVKVTGQVIGQSLSNLDTLVQQPTGCGEQNMIGLVPNVYGVLYIEMTGQQEMDSIVLAMTKNMKHGYQRQVDMYRQDDGSYSAWGTDVVGSTWLTAFVLKSFVAASKFITVDDHVLSSAQSFLESKQNADGLFREDGTVIHKSLQTGTDTGISLTVYCLMAMLEMTRELNSKMQATVSTILMDVPAMISRSATENKDPFLPAMTAYTLSLLTGSYEVEQSIKGLLSLIEDGSPVPWEKSDAERFSQELGNKYLMTAAYTLLTYLQLDNKIQAMKVMRWIQTRQNSLGGYGSTQDTVLILQSLAEYGIHFKNLQETGQITVSVPGTDAQQVFDISGSRSILLQIAALPTNADQVVCTLTGDSNTMAIVKIAYGYNTPTANFEALEDAVIKRNSGKDVELYTRSKSLSEELHQVEACVKSSLDRNSGMYVLTFTLPSGETLSDSRDTMMANNPLVQRVEVDGDNVHFYMDNIPPESYCLKATIERQMIFDVQMPGSAKVYSYYEPEYYKEASVDLSEAIECHLGQCNSAPACCLINFFLALFSCVVTSLMIYL